MVLPAAALDRPRRILVTGGAGFIGTNFVRYWASTHPGDRLVVLDALTYAGNRHSLAGLEHHPGFHFVHGDICDRPLVDALLHGEAIDTVVHLAAESHVDRSIWGPAAFIRTNVQGTFTLLEACRAAWAGCDRARFLHVSTDEVFGSLGPADPPFTEVSPYAPNSPYSASKAGADHLVRAYHRTYGLPTLITYCTNNYGPYQYPEKLIPLVCVNILLGRSLPIYGDGQQVRDWIAVEDHCRALGAVLHRGQPGESYAIGSRCETHNLHLVKTLCDLMDELAPALPVRPARSLITFVGDRPGHDRRYAIDPSKLCTTLGWAPQQTLAAGLRHTAAWYLAQGDWWQPLLPAPAVD